MKNFLKHITQIFIVSGLMLLFGAEAYAQVPAGTSINNVASMDFKYLDGGPGIVKSDTAKSVVEGWGVLTLNKTVSRTTAVVGDTVQFRIVVTNGCNFALASVVVKDTVPAFYNVLSSNRGTRNGNIINWNVGTVAIGAIDTLLISAVVRDTAVGNYLVTNTAVATDSTGAVIQSSATTTVISLALPSMIFTKVASKDTLVVGDTISYKISAKNTGNVTLKNIVVTDTIPSIVAPLSVVGGGIINGRVITFTKDSLKVGETVSFSIIARLPNNHSNNERIVNIASLRSLEIPVKIDTAIVVTKAKANKSCKLVLTATPDRILGNGIDFARIVAFVSDTLGNPKPDGTPVKFASVFGTFGNGQSTNIRYTINGYAIDSLRMFNATNKIFVENTVVTSNDSNNCSSRDSVTIYFYPGAVKGVVYDHKNERTVEGAIVRLLNSADSLIELQTTLKDGKYLFVFAKTGSYTIKITSIDIYGLSTTVTSKIDIVVTGTGEGLKPNKNNISGILYYLISNKPIPIPGIQLDLIPLGLKTKSDLKNKKSGRNPANVIMTSTTDSRGVYKFEDIPVGTFEITINNKGVVGYDTIQVFGEGYYVINGIIPVILNPKLSFTKVGPISALGGDTATYSISASNSGTLYASGTTIVDTLDTAMKFISASNNGVYEPASHRILWNIGIFDSLVSKSVNVKIQFVDTLTSAYTATNRATLLTNEAYPIPAFAKTELVPAVPQIRLTKTADKDSAAIGDTLLYRIVAKNIGNVRLPNFVLRDTINGNLLNILSVSNNAIRLNNIVISSKDTLKVVDSVVVLVRVRVKDRSLDGIFNKAFAQTSLTPIVQSGVITPMKAFDQSNVPNLLLQKFVSRDTVGNGDTLKYTIRFTNNGSVNLTGVVITDTLPPQVVKSVVIGKGILSNNKLIYYRSLLPVGVTDSLVIVSVVNAHTFKSETITNFAYAEANEIQIQSAQATFISKASPVYKLGIIKKVSSPSVFQGDSLRYTITVSNVGNRTVTNIIVRDTIPFQLYNIRTSTNATVNAHVVTFVRDSLLADSTTSFTIDARTLENRPNAEAVLNTAYCKSNETKEQIAQAVVLVMPRVNQDSPLKISKFVSKDTVYIGDTLSYYIRIFNAGTIPLTNVKVVDTLYHDVTPISVNNGASINGTVISYRKTVLMPGESDSIKIIGHLAFIVFDNEIVLNRVFAYADQVSEQTAHALFVSKNDPTCLIKVSAAPQKIIGNGRAAAYIEIKLTNTFGNPKPDGSVVFLSTTSGTFSNGQTSRVLYTKNGIAADSLRAVNAEFNIREAFAIASADDGQGCKAEDTVKIIFYPGAIEGTVINHLTGKPVLAAIVSAYSLTTDSLAGSVITKEDGYYLIPVAKTDSFLVKITTINEFGQEVTVTTIVNVTVTGRGDNPTPNQNSVSGAVYYLVSNQPIPAANLTIVLNTVIVPPVGKGENKSLNGVVTVDSTTTLPDGTFKFNKMPKGRFTLLLKHPSIKGSIEIVNGTSGQYVINANIPIVLNPNIEFVKSGPTRISKSDTAQYTITVKNSGTLSTTGTMLTDSLDRLMKFVSASGNGIYDSTYHKIVWNIGKMDSLSQKVFTVNVRFPDTLNLNVTMTNRAKILSSQTTPIYDSAKTLVFMPPTMRIWKTASVTTAAPGDTVKYVIRLRNIAGSRADSVKVFDELPSQVKYLKYSINTNSNSILDSVRYNVLLHRIDWKLDSLRLVDTVDITLFTIVRNDLEPGDHTYSNIATAQWAGNGSRTSDLDPASSTTVRSMVAYLRITKQAIRKIVEIGDIATYIIRVTNTSKISFAKNVFVADKIPFGFRYLTGSSFRDSVKLIDPTGTKELRWNISDSIAKGATVQFMYRLVVGAGGAEGNGINTAQAFGFSQNGTVMASGIATEQVEIRRGVFSDRGLIVGKVFYDDNNNCYQDSGEVGVKGVELMMEDGTRIVTGDEGKYSLPDVFPGDHVIRIRQHTLPKGVTLHGCYNDFAKDSISRFVHLTEAGIQRVNFYLNRPLVLADEPDSLVLHQAIAKVGDFTVQRIASPKNIVFIEDRRMATMKLTGLNFEIGKAILRSGAYPVLKQLAEIMREYPEQPVSIAGHTDSMKINTKEFPNNKVLSYSRAMSVKKYLVETEQVDEKRIQIEGFGETNPVGANKTKEGRALNRRVEFTFVPSVKQDTINTMPVSIEIPISYTGSEKISKIMIKDILDTAYTFVEGSAVFGDSSVATRIVGDSVYFDIEDVGANFKKSLRYTVNINRPAQNPTRLISRTAKVCFFVGDKMLECIDSLSTANNVGIAVRGRAINFLLSGVLFDVAKSSLRSTALSALDVTANFIKNDLATTVVIEGHTDSSPIHTKEFPSNTELSLARAKTIKQALVSNYGISEDRLSIAGFGEYRPVLSNKTKDGRQANRRIEIRIVRNEFIKNVLPQGSVDSSTVARQFLIPSIAPRVMNSTIKTNKNERYVIKLVVQRKIKRSTHSTILIDTIPSGLKLIPESVSRITGVDSVSVSGNILTAFCSSKDSTMQLAYLVEVTDAIQTESSINHQFIVRKKQPAGTVAQSNSSQTVFEIRKKSMIETK